MKSRRQIALLKLLVSERVRSGLTQNELADKLGRHQSFVSKYESGERRLEILEFVDLCMALGADPGRLIQLLVEDKNIADRRQEINRSASR